MLIIRLLPAVLAGVTLFASEPLFPSPDWPIAPPGMITHDRSAAYGEWLQRHAGNHWASVVIQAGYLIYQGHGPRFHIRHKDDCGSILKPLQGTVLGAALFQGKLKSLDEIANRHWNDAYTTKHENDRAITFRHFASYRDRWNDPEPSGSYRYNNSSATAAGAYIAGLFRPVRGPQARGIAEVTREQVMRPIGADWDLWYWSGDFSDNPSNPGPRMVLESSVYELAKLGYLWLRKGNWKGRRIFSEEFYREATTDWSPQTGSDKFGMVGHYGYWWFVNTKQFWLPALPDDAFYHIGNGDPKRATCLLVVPSWDLVAVLGMTRLSDDGKWDVILNSRTPSNEGVRRWSEAIAELGRR